MIEIKVTISAPELASAINRLADAISRGPAPAAQTVGRPAPAPTAETTITASPTPAPSSDAATALAATTAPMAAATQPPWADFPTKAGTVPTADAHTSASAASPANVPTPADPTTSPAPANSTPSPSKYTLEQISRAGADLIDAGKMQQVLALLAKFGVQAVTQLKKESYTAFGDELVKLGAVI